MKAFKKYTASLLLIIFVLSLISCGDKATEEGKKNREYDAAEVEAAAAELIERSVILNELLYGKGIGYIDDGTTLIYKKADEESLSSFGVSSIADIKSEIEEVFSSSYIATIEKSDIFSPLVDGETTISHTRYFEDGEGEESIFYVNSAYSYVLKNEYEYVSSPKAQRSDGDYVIVRITIRATRSDGKVRDFEHEIKLIEEDAGWRIASQTYVVYNEYTDIYEDMIK